MPQKLMLITRVPLGGFKSCCIGSLQALRAVHDHAHTTPVNCEHVSAVARRLYAVMNVFAARDRAAIMDGLMKVGMRNRLERQHFAMNILLNTYGSDLTTLKVGAPLSDHSG